MKKLVVLILFITLNIYLPAQSMNTETGNTAIVSNPESNSEPILDYVPERIITTSVIVSEIVILFLLLFYWRKTKNDAKVRTQNIYKKNIRAIRDERIKPQNNLDLIAKRKSLQKYKMLNSLDGKSITNRAKKMSIAKGELFLAARINQLQNINT